MKNFTESVAEPISKTCEVRAKGWIMTNCVEVYDVNEECYLPVNCQISNYKCAGQCDLSESLVTFPCSTKY